MRFKLVFSIIGFMSVCCGLAMLVPAATDLFYGWDGAAKRFAVSAALAVSIGVLMCLLTGTDREPLRTKEMFLATALIWISYALLSAIPFFVSEYNLSWTDSVFEAVSGLTTTGSTVLSGLDTLSPGLLLWRSMLQWIGGAGIVIVAIVVLPTLRIGGMQFFGTEASASNRDLPTVVQNMRAILIYFIGLTILCAGALKIAGMTGFDAINHALATISTGGFSTHDLSIGYYHSPLIEWILSGFMLVSSLPLVMGLYLWRRRWQMIRQDAQIGVYLKFLVGAVVLLTTLRWLQDRFLPAELMAYIREAVFAIISVVTTTGFVTENYQLWGNFAIAFFMFLSLAGGCTGSTSGGIKMFRFTILLRTVGVRLKKLVQPHGVFIPRYGTQVITDDILISVLVFFGLYLGTSMVITLILTGMGLDFVTSLSGAFSALSNVGPALGPVIGPDKTFAFLPDGAKWVLSLAMLVGRLEFISIFVLFFPFLWRRNA